MGKFYFTEYEHAEFNAKYKAYAERIFRASGVCEKVSYSDFTGKYGYQVCASVTEAQKVFIKGFESGYFAALNNEENQDECINPNFNRHVTPAYRKGAK